MFFENIAKSKNFKVVVFFFGYSISANSFCGNYSFLNLAMFSKNIEKFWDKAKISWILFEQFLDSIFSRILYGFNFGTQKNEKWIGSWTTWTTWTGYKSKCISRKIQSYAMSQVICKCFVLNALYSKAKQLRIVSRHGIRPDFLEIHLL